jgi:hypothetical protein
MYFGPPVHEPKSARFDVSAGARDQEIGELDVTISDLLRRD